MDFLKRKLGGSGEQYESIITPLSLTLVPPPSVAVNVFIQIQREQKHSFTSRKYLLEPGIATQRKKVTFGGEAMQMTNEYSQKKGGKNQPPMIWVDKEVFISVLSEGVGGKVQVIGTQMINMSKFVAHNTANPQLT